MACEAVLQDGVLVLHHRVGGQAALALAEAHRPPGGVEAHAHLVGRGDLVADPGAVGPQVLVVEGGGAPAVGQFQEADPGGDADIFRGHAGPDGVEALQPGEQAHVLGPGDRPGEGLVEVMVGVDQAGQHEHAGGVHHLVGLCGKVGGGADLFDEAVAGEQAPAGDLPPGRVHGDQGVGVADEQGGHGGRVGREGSGLRSAGARSEEPVAGAVCSRAEAPLTAAGGGGGGWWAVGRWVRRSKRRVAKGGCASICPVLDVVGDAPAGGDVASRVGASMVLQVEGPAQGLGDG